MPELVNLTKTKIRGILSILKHAAIFDTIPDLAEPVKLLLAEHINNFEDLRAKHDEYLLK